LPDRLVGGHPGPVTLGNGAAATTAGSARDWLVVGGGIGLLVASFRPWWGTTVAYRGTGGSGSYERSANAWAASSFWSLAVVLGVVAAGLWLAHRPGADWRRHGRTLAACVLLIALGLTAWQLYKATQGLYCGGRCQAGATGTPAARPAGAAGAGGRARIGGIRRNHLLAYSGTGFEAGLRSGLYLGLAALSAMLLAAGTAVLSRGAESG
jgi:hypothetical protein